MAEDDDDSDSNTMEALPEDMKNADRVRIAANSGEDDDSNDSEEG